MTIALAELAARVGAEVRGDGAVRIARVATLESADGEAIAFLANPRYKAQLAATKAAAVILAPTAASLTVLPKLVSANPYATFAKVATFLHPRATVVPGIHPTAVVGADASIAATASIGPYATIGARAYVGEHVVIGAACAVGADVRIGEDTLLHPHVTVYDECVIGRRGILHSGAVIGADGFGMAEENGRWLKIPQTGRVVIGDDVEVGANTTIDRGALDDTIVEDDVKLDNQIQIGHNCVIGSHTAIAGCVGIAGSTRIGRNCRIGGAAMIGGHLEIAEGTTISGATPVFQSLERGVHTGTFPTLPHREWLRMASSLRRLREIEERLRALEGGAAERDEKRREGAPAIDQGGP